ncbi:MAG: MarR family winged helix-turn-helix transcriptional regulator [Pseudomonadota bacterium]|nr:MarR family winged helix-turn-helix transcriptional regulator [Pseudomonadota bacterium]
MAASECIGFSVRKAARVIAQVYDEVLAPTGLRGTQFSLLNALALSGGATIKQLAGRLVMDRTTLTRNLKPLHKERLIEIAPGADRRQRTVTLTASGRARLREALPLWEQAQTQVLSILGARRADRLRQDLGKLVEGARP